MAKCVLKTRLNGLFSSVCVRVWAHVQMHVVGGTPKRCFGPCVTCFSCPNVARHARAITRGSRAQVVHKCVQLAVNWDEFICTVVLRVSS